MSNCIHLFVPSGLQPYFEIFQYSIKAWFTHFGNIMANWERSCVLTCLLLQLLTPTNLILKFEKNLNSNIFLILSSCDTEIITTKTKLHVHTSSFFKVGLICQGPNHWNEIRLQITVIEKNDLFLVTMFCCRVTIWADLFVFSFKFIACRSLQPTQQQ